MDALVNGNGLVNHPFENGVLIDAHSSGKGLSGPEGARKAQAPAGGLPRARAAAVSDLDRGWSRSATALAGPFGRKRTCG